MAFEQLMDEVKSINEAYGWVGALDAIIFINAHSEQYRGTAVYRELREFMAEGARLFQPVGADHE